MSSSKAKAKALADDFDDNEVASMLELDTPVPADPEQWARDPNGDLDWTYTSRTVRKSSHDALLTHLWNKSFSIPPREYNPSAPFVWVKLHSGDIVTLPHGYRLPLMFVAKYRWETTLNKIANARTWKQERSNLFHLSRLCENLFRRAQAKASRGGMEKGWRCVMFDRLLARFYKHWPRNDPESGRGFLKTHGAKEYDRDVLKHDWKRWCLRGLNGVRMTDDEVTNGITIENFHKGLRKTDDGVWMLDDQPLIHITDEEPQAYSSSSDLTDFSVHEGNPSDADGEGDEIPTSDLLMDTEIPTDANPKRPREFPMDDDEIERETKRVRIENHLETEEMAEPPISPISDRPRRIGNLSRTLAAMARNPVWANSGRLPPPPTSKDISELNSATPAPAASEPGPSGTTPTPTPTPTTSVALPPPEASMDSLPENASEDGPPVSTDTSSANPSSVITSTRRVRHASQTREAEGPARLEPIYIPTPSFFTSTRTDKYPWPPALGVNEARTHSEIRMFQECTAPDTWDVDDGSITWRAAGTIAWSDEKVWRATAAANTSDEALGLAQTAASTSRPSRAASMKSRQLTKAASKNPLAGRSLQRAMQRGKARERDKGKDKEKDEDRDTEKDTEQDMEQEKEKEAVVGSVSAPPRPRPRPRPRLGPSSSRTAARTSSAAAKATSVAAKASSVVAKTTSVATKTTSVAAKTTSMAAKASSVAAKTSSAATKVSSVVAKVSSVATKLSSVAARASSPARSQSSLSSISTPIAKRVATPAQHHDRQQRPLSTRNANPVIVENTDVGPAAESGDVPQSAVHAKALELLVNLLDVKQVLENSFTAAAAATSAGASSSSSGGAAEREADAERVREEREALDVRLEEFEGRFATMKEELAIIVERLQVLETEAEKNPERAVALRQEEEEEDEEEETGVDNLEDSSFPDMEMGDGLNDEIEIESEELDVEREIEKEMEMEDADKEPDGEIETPTGEGADTQTGIPDETDPNAAEKTAEQEPDIPQEKRKGKEAQSDKDVVMDEADTEREEAVGVATAASASAANVEPPQRTYGEISIQTDDLIDEELTYPPPSPTPAPVTNDAAAIPQPQETPTQPEDAQAAAQAIPTPSEHDSLQDQLRTVEPNHPGAHQHASSEPDTDITMVNATASSSVSSSALMKEESLPLDSRTRDISSNLSLLVDSLVSTKMLAVMESMVRTRVADKEADAVKEKDRLETIKEGSVASSSTDVQCERDAPPPPPHPLHRDTVALTQSPDSYAVAQLLDEVRNMQKQSQLREQREKEELQAMRELHSAEVDALRRRLSYLETQQRHSAETSNVIQPAASSSILPHLHTHPTHAESSYISHPQPRLQSHPPAPRDGDVDMESSWQSRQQRYSASAASYQYSNGNENSHAQSSASPVETEPPTKEPPVRIYTDRSFTFRMPGKDRDDEVPLPIKSQRKQHMVFPRAQYG